MQLNPQSVFTNMPIQSAGLGVQALCTITPQMAFMQTVAAMQKKVSNCCLCIIWIKLQKPGLEWGQVYKSTLKKYKAFWILHEKDIYSIRLQKLISDIALHSFHVWEKLSFNLVLFANLVN